MTDAIDCEFSIEGNGPPLILIHGVGAGRNTWARTLPLLTRYFTVVTYDLRGHGASPLPSGPFGLDELVADLERVRQRAGIDRAHIAGHSLGGMIAAAYALKYPDRVLSLGLLSTPAFRTKDVSAGVQGVLHAMEQQGIAPVLPTLTQRWFTDLFIAENPDVVQARLDQVMATDHHVFLTAFGIYADTEMAPWLDQITAPALVVTGQDDPGCTPRLNRLIAGALPNSDLVILPQLKHALLLEAGDVVAGHIVRFTTALATPAD